MHLLYQWQARRALLKLKNVVKLQAAVRGHLVRRHAVGTLRCVQAIVKMQLLIRARRTRLFREGSCPEKLDAALNEESPTTLVILLKFGHSCESFCFFHK